MMNWIFGNQSVPYARTGTTPPISIKRNPMIDPKPVRAGKDYFLIQVIAAQAAFHGNIWDQVEQLVVTSQINLNHRNLDNRALRAIQRTRRVEKNQSQPLGLTPNLISLVPAAMSNVTISIDFIVDKKNRLAALGGLINSDSFSTVLSLAPGASAIAKTVAGLADKIIQTFIPAEDSKPILEFGGDFNIGTESLQDGFYVIIGTKDEQTPLPEPDSKLEIRNQQLYINGEPATQWSYIILDVQCAETRPRELSNGATWDLKLQEAEDEAQRLLLDPLSTDDERKSTWRKCLKLIEEAQTLLRADDNFLRQDAINMPNRALLFDRLQHAFMEAMRHQQGLALLFLDLDDFKSVNDRFGHAMGDQLLVEVAKRMLLLVRQEDTVARLGGDEFTVLIKNPLSVEAVIGTANRILEKISESYQMSDVSLNISASIGVTMSYPRGDQPEDLLREADQAMYQAKSGGKSKIHLHMHNSEPISKDIIN